MDQGSPSFFVSFPFSRALFMLFNLEPVSRAQNKVEGPALFLRTRQGRQLIFQGHSRASNGQRCSSGRDQVLQH